jgi:hypothetical protein
VKRDFIRQFVDRQRVLLADPIVRDSAEARAAAAMLDKLEEEHNLYLDERLTPQQAAAESGFTGAHIRFLRSQGVISDRRRDLPRKAGFGVDRQGPEPVAPRAAASLVDDVLEARHSRSKRRVG